MWPPAQPRRMPAAATPQRATEDQRNRLSVIETRMNDRSGSSDRPPERADCAQFLDYNETVLIAEAGDDRCRSPSIVARKRCVSSSACRILIPSVEIGSPTVSETGHG